MASNFSLVLIFFFFSFLRIRGFLCSVYWDFFSLMGLLDFFFFQILVQIFLGFFFWRESRANKFFFLLVKGVFNFD